MNHNITPHPILDEFSVLSFVKMIQITISNKESEIKITKNAKQIKQTINIKYIVHDYYMNMNNT